MANMGGSHYVLGSVNISLRVSISASSVLDFNQPPQLHIHHPRGHQSTRIHRCHCSAHDNPDLRRSHDICGLLGMDI